VRKSRAVAVSPDGRSLYDASSSGITTFKRSVSGALTYDGCIENHGTHGCQAPVHDSLRFPNDLALSRDGESVYVASSFADSITDLKRADDGTLTYGGCFADEGVRGCQVPVHDSLSRALGVAVSADGRSVYVAASQPANASTSFSRENSAP
jgi:sugar lactone lactonase YvrE